MARKKQTPDQGQEEKEKRRGHGEGSWLYLEGLDKWRFRVSAKTPDGITKRFAVTAATKTECREMAKAKAEQVEKGIGLNVDTKNITVAEYLERWIVDYSDPDTSTSTGKTYRAMIKNCLTEELGTIPLKKLQRPACQRHFNKLAKKGLSTAMVSLAHVVLHAALKQAVRDKIIGENPVSELKLAQVKNKQRIAYSTEEVAKVLKMVENHPLRIGFHLIFGLALRESEMLGLHWNNVEMTEVRRDQPDQPEGKVNIVEQLTRDNGLLYGPLKTEDSERILPLSAELANELRLQKLRQKELLLKLGLSWNESLPVVSNEIGRAVGRDRFSKDYRAVMKAAGLQTTGTHDARHTRLIMMGNSGMDPKTLSRFAGHKDVAFTLNVYVTPSDEAAAAAVKQIDKVIYQSK